MLKRAYKTELDLNDEQRTACLQHAGAARYAYNWGLQQKIETYTRGENVPTAIDLHKRLNVLKKGELAWMYGVSKCAPQEALRHLDKAFEHFFRRCQQGAKKKGFPRFKSRKRGVGSFTLTGAIHVWASSIQLPHLGELRLKESGYLPVGANVSQATVSERAGHWFVSVLVEAEPLPQTPATMPVVGVDLGVKTLATLSDGRQIENPRTLSRFQRKLVRAQRQVSRRVKGSHRRQRAVKRLAQLHYRIANIRTDAIHQFTTHLTRKSSVICVEDLNVAGMLANHGLAGAIADAAFGEIRRQIEYKAAWRGVRAVIADRFYPSSKTCHVCGAIHDGLTLTDREWTCECGAHHDRDVNAALNLRTFAVSSTEKSNGRGAGSADAGTRANVELPAMKRQPNTAERGSAAVSVG